ncbi:hypothetical protein BACT_0491 [Bifidobacterium actinocoloniiforme DSM 22766]|uniref:Uncharacterized protein n=1 Tax=Bifidobacterium actinocoloniiforme DSM 22766 TaxID=1437605 RepID=A0A086YZU1_9BIFI|nr:hypothetical protein [Bifidobacterium actinocoloniiforme]AKV55079.1 hypothetical protein AB656_01075 [Bifidobacterium actinocoloniiforme DSM 22766]KFI39791.1 hypothetical protein BACT_0491 [Bifidobacterium actinocoloniiforme DSM 22766]
MSVFNPPVHPVRTEETLLPLLRGEYPDVSFGSVRNSDDPPRECVLVGDPQGLATPVTQWVRVRLTVIVRRDDGSGDFAAEQHLAADIIRTITMQGCRPPIVSAKLDAGPMRLADGDASPIYCYAVLLMQAAVS